MIALCSLLFRPRLRHYALLDENGVCRALRQCAQPPTDGRWVEIEQGLPHWLNRPLPAGARLPQPARAARLRRRLALH